MPRGQIAPPGDQIAFWASMRSLAAIVGRSGAPHLRLRLGVALVLTVAGKLTGVVAPLLLELGHHPSAAAASASAMVVCSGSLSLASFAAEGLVASDSMLVFGSAAFIAAAVGVTGAAHVVRRSGRASVLVAGLAAVLAMALVMSTVDGVWDFVRHWRQGRPQGFHNVCTAR